MRRPRMAARLSSNEQILNMKIKATRLIQFAIVLIILIITLLPFPAALFVLLADMF